MAIRERISEVASNDVKLDRFRRALARMQGRRDDRGYGFFAGLHGLPLPSYCVHGGDLFLPWHRAYLYYFELALQTRLGPSFTVIEPEVAEFADVGLPWWDWASDQAHIDGLPDAYEQPDVDGSPNPLAAADFNWPSDLVDGLRNHWRLRAALTSSGPARTLRDPDDPDDLPRQRSIDGRIMTTRTYPDFNRAVEQVHGQVHVWVGGSMGEVPTAAYDPIFWSHHAMIDRQWHLWQLSQNGVDPRPSLHSRPLPPFPLTVEQTLDVEALGVEYAVESSEGN